MKRSHTALAIFATIVLALGSFALGYFIQSNANGTPDGSATFARPSETVDEEAEHDRRQAQDKQEQFSIKELSDPARFKSRIARTLALVKSVQNSNASELSGFLNQSKAMQSGDWQKEIQNAIIQRLAVLDPTSALAEVSEFTDARQQSLLPIVYREWALTNLEEAISNARNLDEKFRLRVIRSIVRSRADLPLDQRRSIARSFDQEWVAIQLLKQESNQEPISDPRQELNDLLSRSSSTAESWSNEQNQFLAQILIVWLSQEGIDAFEEIEASLPDAFLGETAPAFSVINELAVNNPELALQLSVAAGSVGFGGLAWLTVRRWAESDPLAAFNAVSLLEGRSLKRMLQDQVLVSWAAQNPHELLDATHTIPQELQSIAQEKALSALAESSPQTASKLLGEIENKDARDRTAKNIAFSWARLDIDGVLEWIGNDELVSDLQSSLYESVITSVVSLNPQLAVRKALDLPTDNEGVGPEGSAFRILASSDLDLAISLLPQARNGPTRLAAYDAVINNLLDEHSDFRKAMDLFVEVANEEPISGFNSALHSLVWDTPLQLFESLDEIPTDHLKKRVAGDLLVHESKGLFSDDQLTRLREVSGRSPRPPRSPELDAAFKELSEAVLETFE
ncbi:MAG: hypothetical protein F4X44_03290 [Gammaproteobacteria bacterium]|nr:hypothetical protein [Gammaproteobacteria bacterium]